MYLQPLQLNSCIFAPKTTMELSFGLHCFILDIFCCNILFLIKSNKQKINSEASGRIDTARDTNRADQRTDPCQNKTSSYLPLLRAQWSRGLAGRAPARQLSRLRALHRQLSRMYVSVRACCGWNLKKLQRVWSKTNLIQTQRTHTDLRTDLNPPCRNMNTMKTLALPLLIALLHCEFLFFYFLETLLNNMLTLLVTEQEAVISLDT